MQKREKTYPRPAWVTSSEEELCPTCFKAVGDRNRYKLILTLGKNVNGLNVTQMTKLLGTAQPTITHHLNILREVDAVRVETRGRERIYKLNRQAHCFEDCHIPFN